MICDVFIGRFKLHPLASIFPLRTPSRFNGDLFEESVKKIGVRVPVVLDQNGRLVDGRNRARTYEANCALDPKFRKRFPELPMEVRHFANPGEVFSFLKMINTVPKTFSKGQVLANFTRILGMMGEVGEPLSPCQLAVWTKSNHSQASKALRLLRIAPQCLQQVGEGAITLDAAIKQLKTPNEFIKEDITQKCFQNGLDDRANAQPPGALWETTANGELQYLMSFNG